MNDQYLNLEKALDQPLHWLYLAEHLNLNRYAQEIWEELQSKENLQLLVQNQSGVEQMLKVLSEQTTELERKLLRQQNLKNPPSRASDPMIVIRTQAENKSVVERQISEAIWLQLGLHEQCRIERLIQEFPMIETRLKALTETILT
ncbi:hypothetical protein [Pokkaliibacter plantistimulans]|uniref:hypothetical protein n=1 Tax=Pokkaliibacter plantistimulans TaxID=1635171 RepID=UPI0026C3B783|nr:hypothetical protein [Pokkaliibacter plantistimulans]